MKNCLFYIHSNQTVNRICGKALKDAGIQLADTPNNEVTHLLLPIPSFNDDGTLKGGGNIYDLLNQLSDTVTIIGGNLPEALCGAHPCIDLLKDPLYMAQNAYITACCAMRIITMELPVILRGCKILIIGWGRIAQCLAHLLRNVEADVTLMIRCPRQRALASALGYQTIAPEFISELIPLMRVICNTAPAEIITEEISMRCTADCLKMDLASTKGIAGSNVLWARGLPGKDAPESSGKLIAETILQRIQEA